MKPALVISTLVIECAEVRGTGVWMVQYLWPKRPQEVHGNTYATEAVANGVANRYLREGREVLGVYAYDAVEVAHTVAAWRASRP